MKAAIKISGAISLLAVLCLVSGCGTVQVSPSWWFKHEISSTDRIVVTNLLAAFPSTWSDAPQDQSLKYSLTITGPDAKAIAHAISTMHTEVDWSGYTISATAYEWRLNFYRGQKLLGEAGMSPDLIECGDYEYPSPPVLKKLYERVEQESRGAPAK